jgi:hypothetical protein
VKVMPVRISAVVFTPFPIQDSRANTAIKDDVFNSLIAFLGAFAQLLNNAVSFFRMSIEDRRLMSIARTIPSSVWYMVRIAFSQMPSISNPAIRTPVAIRIIVINLSPVVALALQLSQGQALSSHLELIRELRVLQSHWLCLLMLVRLCSAFQASKAGKAASNCCLEKVRIQQIQYLQILNHWQLNRLVDLENAELRLL